MHGQLRSVVMYVMMIINTPIPLSFPHKHVMRSGKKCVGVPPTPPSPLSDLSRACAAAMHVWPLKHPGAAPPLQPSMIFFFFFISRCCRLCSQEILVRTFWRQWFSHTRWSDKLHACIAYEFSIHPPPEIENYIKPTRSNTVKWYNKHTCSCTYECIWDTS